MIIEGAAKGDNGIFDRHQLHGLAIAALHLGLITPDNRANTRQNRQRVGISAKAASSLFQVLIVGACFIEALGVDKDRIRILSGEVTPGLGSACLKITG